MLPAPQGGEAAAPKQRARIASRTVALRAPPTSFTTGTFANPRQVRGRRPTLRLIRPADDVPERGPLRAESEACPAASGASEGPLSEGKRAFGRHIRRSVGRRGRSAAAPERRWRRSSQLGESSGALAVRARVRVFPRGCVKSRRVSPRRGRARARCSCLRAPCCQQASPSRRRKHRQIGSCRKAA